MARHIPTQEPPDFPDEELLPDKPAPNGRQLLRMFVPVAIAIVVFVAALLLVLKFLVIPAMERGDPAAQARGVATLGALQTREALSRTDAGAGTQATPQPQPQVTPAPLIVQPLQPAQPTSVSTPAVTSAPAAVQAAAPVLPTLQAGKEPTSIPASSVQNNQSVSAQPSTSAIAQPAASTTAELQATGSCPASDTAIDTSTSQRLLNAHQLYWSDRTLALRDLDMAPMEGVAVGKGLSGMQQWIDDLRSKNTAISTHVRHHVCLLWATADQAVVSDEYEDLSYYIDPISKEPLDASAPVPQSGPLVKVRDLFQSDSGTWKWAGSEFYD